MLRFIVGIAAVLILARPVSAQSADQVGPTPRFEELVKKAEAARDAKRLGEALILYQHALDLKPGWNDGWGIAGSLAFELDRYAECASAFRRLTALKPDLVPAWTMAGLCEYQLRDYEASLKSLTQVQRLGFPANRDLSQAAMFHLALVLAKLGYSEKAIAWLHKLTLIERKKTPDMIVAVGIAGLRKPWTPLEVPASERDKVLKLGDAMTTFMIGGDPKEAFDKFEAALRQYPEEPNFHYRFGAFLLEQDSERGIAEIRKGLELEPNHIPALVALARVYIRRNEPQLALPYAQKAAKLGSEDMTARLTLGQTLLSTGDVVGAVRELEFTVKHVPESPAAHYSLAQAYAKMGRNEDAAREREEFKRLREPGDSGQP